MGYFTAAARAVEPKQTRQHPPGFNYTKIQNGVMNGGMNVHNAGDLDYWLAGGWWIDTEHHAKGVPDECL